MATARMTTAVEVKTQKGVAEPSFGNIQRGANFPASMEEESSSWITPEPKNEAQVLGKNIWLFQLLRGHRVAAPAVLQEIQELDIGGSSSVLSLFLLL